MFIYQVYVTVFSIVKVPWSKGWQTSAFWVAKFYRFKYFWWLNLVSKEVERVFRHTLKRIFSEPRCNHGLLNTRPDMLPLIFLKHAIASTWSLEYSHFSPLVYLTCVVKTTSSFLWIWGKYGDYWCFCFKVNNSWRKKE